MSTRSPRQNAEYMRGYRKAHREKVNETTKLSTRRWRLWKAMRDALARHGITLGDASDGAPTLQSGARNVRVPRVYGVAPSAPDLEPRRANFNNEQ